MHDVRFPNGDVKEYAANVIAENLMSQIDDEGFSLTKLKAIVDHRTDDDAITKDKMYTVNKFGRKRMRQTTVGWHLLVLWENGVRASHKAWTRRSETMYYNNTNWMSIRKSNNDT